MMRKNSGQKLLMIVVYDDCLIALKFVDVNNDNPHQMSGFTTPSGHPRLLDHAIAMPARLGNSSPSGIIGENHC